MNSIMQTGLKFSIEIQGIDADVLNVVSYTLTEGLSEPFSLEAQLVSAREEIEAADVLEKPMLLQVWQDGILQSQLHACVYQFTAASESFEKTSYELVAGPSLLRLQWRQNSRIFQRQNVQTIMDTVLKERGVVDVEFIFKRSLPEREYCVQYFESDYDFICRLAAEEGMQFFFVHESGKHTLRFVDDKITHPRLGESVPYNGNVQGIGELRPGYHSGRELFISYFKLKTQVASASAYLKDYNFKTPTVDYSQKKQGAELDAQRSDYEYFDYPGRYKSSGVGKDFSQHRIDALRRDAEVGDGRSNHPEIRCGFMFNLSQHSRRSFNQQWLVTQVVHYAEQAQALEESAADGKTSYRNEFKVIPAHLQWRPDNLPKPQIDGLQVATITGPPGEEIYCDEFARVKVQFPWDRYGKSDENSSCWMRVANVSSGGKWGMISIPRIGHEVLVSHLNGDPDQPIVVGRTFNAKNMPPYDLPANKTRSTWKSDSHKSMGSNEIRYEDATGQEEIYMHAQKDINSVIENSETRTLNKGNRSINLKVGDESKAIDQGNLSETICCTRSTHANVVQVNAKASEVGPGTQLYEASDKIELKVGESSIVLDTQRIVIRHASSVITLDAEGIDQLGKIIQLNKDKG